MSLLASCFCLLIIFAFSFSVISDDCSSSFFLFLSLFLFSRKCCDSTIRLLKGTYLVLVFGFVDLS